MTYITKEYSIWSILNPSSNRRPVLGTNYLKFEWFVPTYRAAVLMGLSFIGGKKGNYHLLVLGQFFHRRYLQSVNKKTISARSHYYIHELLPPEINVGINWYFSPQNMPGLSPRSIQGCFRLLHQAPRKYRKSAVRTFSTQLWVRRRSKPSNGWNNTW